MGQTYEIRLAHLAKSLAKSLKHEDVSTFLHSKLAEQFDGEYSVLWKDISSKELKGHGRLRGVIQGYLRKNVVSMNEIEDVPMLHITCPIGFAEWDGSTPILVGYNPYSTQESEWETIFAYDDKGNRHELSADSPPDFPVLIVGINEHTDIEGNLLPGTVSQMGFAKTQPIDDDGGDSGG